MGEIGIDTINHVAFPISDRKKTLPFYRDVPGLKVVPSMIPGDRVIWTQMGDGTMVHPIDRTADGTPVVYHIAFEVEDFDAAFERLEELGIEMTHYGERYDGQRFLYFHDPDGNRVELVTANNPDAHDRTVDEWGYTKPGKKERPFTSIPYERKKDGDAD